MKRAIKVAMEILRRIEWVCLAIPMAALVIFVSVQIIFRLNSVEGLSWLAEFGRYVFVFCTFLGISVAIHVDSYPRIKAVLLAVPRGPRYVLLIAGDLLGCAACFYLTYHGYIQISRQVTSAAMSTALPVLVYVPYLMIPIGLLTSGMRYAASLVKNAMALAAEQKADRGN